MTRLLLLLTLAGLLAGCSIPGRDLPLVKASDPTWSMTQDHLEPGSLP